MLQPRSRCRTRRRSVRSIDRLRVVVVDPEGWQELDLVGRREPVSARRDGESCRIAQPTATFDSLRSFATLRVTPSGASSAPILVKDALPSVWVIAWGRKSGGSPMEPATVLPSLIAMPKLLILANGPGTIAEPPFQITSLLPRPGLPVPTITPAALTSFALLASPTSLPRSWIGNVPSYRNP